VILLSSRLMRLLLALKRHRNDKQHSRGRLCHTSRPGGEAHSTPDSRALLARTRYTADARGEALAWQRQGARPLAPARGRRRYTGLTRGRVCSMALTPDPSPRRRGE
jgi:hypothetical protein